MSSFKGRGEDPRSFRPAHLCRAAALAVVTALTVAAAAPPAGAAPEVADGPTAARWGAAWLDAQMELGLPLETFGSPDWGTTLEAGLALAAVDGNQARTASLWEAVEAQRETIVTAAGADVPGRLALAILYAVAVGEDPTAVGDAPGGDLVARLEATLTVGGANDGLFGSQDPTYDGAYRQGYALAALAAAGETPPPTAVAWLVDQQCDDGSWMPYRADVGVACAFDGALFVGPDSNSTAAAVSGLAETGAAGSPAVTDALAWLDAVQHDDGGWSFFPTDVSDPNSSATVVMALRSAGALGDAAFDDRAGSPLEGLLSFQLGCTEGIDAGAFTYPGSNDAPNTFATAQAVSAVAGATLGITAPVVSGTFADPCPPATTTTTTTVPTSTTTPAPTTSAVVPVTAPTGSANTPGAGIASADQSRAGALALTGSSPGGPVRAGALLLALGVVLLAVARRSRRA